MVIRRRLRRTGSRFCEPVRMRWATPANDACNGTTFASCCPSSWLHWAVAHQHKLKGSHGHENSRTRPWKVQNGGAHTWEHAFTHAGNAATTRTISSAGQVRLDEGRLSHHPRTRAPAARSRYRKCVAKPGDDASISGKTFANGKTDRTKTRTTHAATRTQIQFLTSSCLAPTTRHDQLSIWLPILNGADVASTE